ncbi:PREDICTED: LOW QUALITY PROTEIN: U-box domain-containing protein 34-like [Branchiostoma belcheri]|uniref:LOW QUALITY PROTEIN: U-box domain-containing protein 34-like n=1 Tax=Branchiostoma belcheri TaxID=7741 RepID=A0A6P4ZHN8_BRABE|nr:PREDICTED: LOW QUALITY PROTEIN: U-box domain-containing protein 34-like [Branchiostoma belcheri]
MTKDITEADIDAMKTREVYRLLDDFGVDGEDLEPSEAKTALKEKIKQMKEEAEKATSPEQVAEKMADIAESYKAKRELLLKRCQDVTDYLPNLDPSEREKLALHFKRDVMDILSEVEDHLSKDDCPILVAGKPVYRQQRKITEKFLETATEEAADVFSDFLRGEEVRKHLSTVPIKATTEDNAIAELSLAIEIYMMKKCQPFKDKVRAANTQFRAKLESMVARVNHEHNEKIRPVTGRRHQLNVEDVVGNRQTNAWFEWLNQTVRRLNGPYLSIMSAFKGDCEHTERSRLSEMAIAAMATEGEVFAIARNNLLKSFQLLGAFESDLQGVKDVEERLVEERFSETRNQIDLVSKYEPQASDITLQLGRLAMVDLSEMREYEFDLDNIIGWQDPQNKIGGGSYGEVYRVDVQRDSARVRAALKIGVLPYALTTKDNAWNFLAEEDNLRKLRGEHIVEYYGTACRREGGGLRLGLVMELCEGTLEDRVVGQREHNPTWWEHDRIRKREAFRYIQDKSVQLCEGLRTIHDAGYIHRDLKLINVLVTAGDVVKLADVGVTKREVDVTGTVTGTAIYAAPEVKNRQLYDKSADIYSLGLLLWEMWYGRTVWNAMEDPSLKSLTEGESMMMPQSPASVRPIPEWATLVRECQHKNANKRPSALECLQRIRDMTTEVGPQRSISFQTTV